MPAPDNATRLAALARPSGALAMLALDQRESLRAMLADRRGGGRVPDANLTSFKVAAARALAPSASAVLLDVAYGLRPVLEAGAIPRGVGLIVAADRLVQSPGGPVESTDVDEAVLADDAIAAIVDAYKLLVIWRPDVDGARRRRTVEAFLAGCRSRGKPGIVEGIVRPPDGVTLTANQHVELVVEAGLELGAAADLYKAEVPTLARPDDAAVEAGARAVTEALPGPWVVLSNGTAPDRFDAAAVASARGGASGFLAGRAIWQRSIAARDPAADMRDVAAPRLRALAERMDRVARPWHAAGTGR
ncbi:MAG TPA: hypothetical protein VFV72_04280 [Candidatus Limnocylindrales bacterium]|nr:hypothetical protein [Candidatus Limnocylindrales bacterium]